MQTLSSRHEGVPTSRLITEYEYAKQLLASAEAVLKQRVVDESGFKVGDIVRHLRHDGTHYGPNKGEHIISRLEGFITYWLNNELQMGVRAWTRKRTKTGWHAVENEQYQINSERSRPYPRAHYWKVVGHEDLGGEKDAAI